MNDTIATGFAQPGTANNDSNAMDFLVRMMQGKMWTSTVVMVQSVTNDGGLSPVGFVDVQPMVNQVDGAGKAKPHGVIRKIPYFRLQGGTNAVIIDPCVGDIGGCFFAHSDTSSVKKNKAISNPGSNRRNNPSDGFYIGGYLNGVPIQYIMFASAGINIVSPTKITMSAPNVEIDATDALTVNTPNTALSTNLTIGGTTIGTGIGRFAGVGVSTHIHNTPVGKTTPPIAGS